MAKTALNALGVAKAIEEVTKLATAIYSVGTAFETSMAKVSTIADTSRASMAQLTDGVMKLSNETGAAATELSNAMYEAISANVDTANAVQFTEQAVKLAKGGFTDAASAVDVMTTVLNAYKMEATEAANVSDILIQVQNKGKTTVNELAANMGRVIPTASAYGVSLENLGAAYAKMTANGIATAETTTYVNSMLNELGKSGTTASDALKEISGKSFKELMSEGNSLGDVLQMLEDKAEKSGLSIADMFGSAEAGKAALTLLSEGADGFNKSLADMQKSTGLTENAFETMADTAENSAEVIKNKFKNLGIEIFDENSESIDRIMTKVGELADGFIDFAKNAAVKFADALEWVIDNASTLTTVIMSGVNAFAAYKAAMLVMSAIPVTLNAITLAKTLLSTVTDVLTGKIKLATVAQLALDAAQKAGTGLIGLAVAAIAAGITALVSWSKNADTAANRTKALKEELEAINEEYESAKKSAEENAATKEAEIRTAETHMKRLEELDKIMKTASSDTDEYTAAANELKSVVDKLNEAFPDLKLEIDKETGALKNNTNEVEKLFTAYKNLYTLRIRGDLYEEQLKAAESAVMAAEETLANTDQYADTTDEKVEKAMSNLPSWMQNSIAGATYSFNTARFMADDTTTVAYDTAKQALADAEAERDRIYKLWGETESAYNEANASVQQRSISEGLSTDAARAEKFLDTTLKSAETAETVAEKVKLSYDDQLKALERSHKLGEISDAQYYKNLTKLRDEYLDESSDEWVEATVDINNYREKAAKEAAALTEEQIQAEFDALDRRYELGEISEEEYYNELERLRDTYLDETSDEWLDATLKIRDYNKQVAENAEAALTAAASAVKEKLEELESNQSAFAQKLLGSSALIEKKTKTLQFGAGPAVDVEYTELADLKTQAENMQLYADSLEKLKSRGGLPEGFFAELRDMSMEEGQEYANALLRLSDEEYAAYMESWQKKKDLADEISKQVYTDEASALKTALEQEFGEIPEDFFNIGEDSAEKYSEGFLGALPTDEVSVLKTALEQEFGEIPEDFFDIGENSAEKYGEGFLSALPRLMETIKAQISAGLATLLPTVLATGGTGSNVTYNNTYNVQPSAGESTQAQLLAISNAQNLNEQRGV